VRRRLLRALLAVTVVAVAVLGIPLGFVASHVVRDEEVRRLDREADVIGFAIDDQLEIGEPVIAADIARVTRPGRQVVVVDHQGRRTVVGRRPAGATIEADVRTVQGAEITVVADAAGADARARRAWAVVAGLSLAGMLAAVLLAAVEARRLGRPLDDLARASRRLGGGDFSVRVPASGLPEVDAVAAALAHSGDRIADLVRREREFAANASHQLRTPLTALRVRLEEATLSGDDLAPAVEDALREADRLETTITELLRLSRSDGAGAGVAPAGDLLSACRARWLPLCERARRPLEVAVAPEATDAALPEGPVAEILNVLLDNALHHGGGRIRLAARRTGDHVLLVVADDGAGIPPGLEQAIFERHVSGEGSSGVGLALARTLALSVGGRLELARARPAVFEVYVPVTEVPSVASRHG
jgi:signal transduction histidine kinase